MVCTGVERGVQVCQDAQVHNVCSLRHLHVPEGLQALGIRRPGAGLLHRGPEGTPAGSRRGSCEVRIHLVSDVRKFHALRTMSQFRAWSILSTLCTFIGLEWLRRMTHSDSVMRALNLKLSTIMRTCMYSQPDLERTGWATANSIHGFGRHFQLEDERPSLAASPKGA